MSTGNTIIIADDHSLIRSALVALLDSCLGLSVVAEVGDADNALRETARHKPDVVVLDIDMPGVDSFQAASEVRQISPKTEVVFLSGACNDRFIEAAKAAGARGYVYKGDDPAELVSAIRAIVEGGTFYSTTVSERISTATSGDGGSKFSMLSSRELETLRYIAKGLAKKEIAPLMHISVKTVDKHVTQLMSKLEIHDRVGLARYAIREGLIDP
jgi:NarL family two-component system response regulator LiaR